MKPKASKPNSLPLTKAKKTARLRNTGLTNTSFVDPNTLNLDPDPGFWPNLDQDPG